MDDGDEEESSTKEEGSRQEEVGKGGGERSHGNPREHSCTPILSSELRAERRKVRR
jgi:hypothetical protein